jgi:hypothetical protein
MQNFNLDDFLKNYKPKILEDTLKPYIQLKKLTGYGLLKHNNKELLIPGKTYIRYVKHMTAFQDGHYKDHVKPGGLLVAGGVMHMGRFMATDNKPDWTHLVLKYDYVEDPSKNKKKNVITVSVPKERVFTIGISTNYIFFRKFESKDDRLREYFVELLK